MLVEDRSKKLVSQWALRSTESDAVVQVGQTIEEPPFHDGDPGPLVASWVQYDPRRDVQEVDVGAVFLDRLGTSARLG